ncbi:MAG: hypothetical protein EA424_20770 [Planctomycetaceae bacterium]|nr:MAG: hypothetical protein EA424_20770 [Planctomycetaceae bacterium]
MNTHGDAPLPQIVSRPAGATRQRQITHIQVFESLTQHQTPVAGFQLAARGQLVQPSTAKRVNPAGERPIAT